MRTFVLSSVLSLTLTACATTTTQQPAVQSDSSREAVDLLIRNGIIVPINGANIDAGAVAVRGGVIVAVGPSAEVEQRYRATEVIDARGSAVLPGLINTHTHAPMTLFRGIADDRDLMEWLQNFIFPAEAKNVDQEFVKWGTRLALAEMIASGTTTYADMYYFEADIARETRAAGMRGVLGETLIDFPVPDNKTWDEAIAYMRRYAAEFKNDPLITPAVAPHAPYTVSPDHLRQVRALATELQVPILIHLAETENESAQIRERYQSPSPVQHVNSIGLLGDDVVAAHAVWLSDEDIRILAQKRVGVAHCPESNMMLASGVARIPELLSAGVETGLGTDGPAGSNNNLDMFEEMASAARLQKVTRNDPKALTARRVLEMATINGARVLGLDQKVGSLEPGKRADIIVVKLDQPKTQPIYSVESALVYAASGDDVTHTIVDGRVLMRDRKLLTIDVASVVAKADEYRARVTASLARQ